MSTQRVIRGILLTLSFSLLSVLLGMEMLLSAPSTFAHGTPTPRTWRAVVGVQSKDQAIQGMAFLPDELWVNVGDTIIWHARRGDIHTVTFFKPGQALPPCRNHHCSSLIVVPQSC